jgi:hypothetical protein
MASKGEKLGLMTNIFLFWMPLRNGLLEWEVASLRDADYDVVESCPTRKGFTPVGRSPLSCGVIESNASSRQLSLLVAVRPAAARIRVIRLQLARGSKNSSNSLVIDPRKKNSLNSLNSPLNKKFLAVELKIIRR